MNLKKIVDCILFNAKHISRSGSTATWYLFGSIIGSTYAAKDVDLLVVCENHDTATIVREIMRRPCLCIPLHIVLLTTEEETELGFIESEDCVEIYPDSELSNK